MASLVFSPNPRPNVLVMKEGGRHVHLLVGASGGTAGLGREMSVKRHCKQ